MNSVLEVILKAKDELSGPANAIGKQLDKLGNLGAEVGKKAAIGIGVIGVAAAGAAAGLFKLGESFDSAFDKIQIQTGATGAELDTLKGSFREVFGSIPTDMESASTAIAGFAQKTGATGETLESLSKTAIRLSDLTGTDLNKNIDGVTKLMNNWGLEASQGTGLMDKLFVASQKTGTGVDAITESITKFGPTLREMGFSLKESIALTASLEKAGIDADAMFAGLKKAVVNFAKDGKTASQGMTEAFNTIKNAGSSTEAVAAAMEVFGAKAGPDLAAAIRTGQFSVEQLIDDLGGADDAILTTAENTADFGEKFTVLKNKALLALEPIAIKTLEMATVFAEKAAPHVQKFADFVGVYLPVALALMLASWQTYGEPFIEAVITLGTTVLEKVQPPLMTLFNFFRTNESAWQALAVGIGTVLVAAFIALGVSAGVAAVSMVIAAAPIIALIAVIALLGAGIFLLIKHWDTIVQKVPALGVAFDVVKKAIEVMLSTAEGYLRGFATFLDGYITVLIGIFNVLTAFFTGDWDKAWKGLQQIGEGALKMLEGAVALALAPIKALFSVFGTDIGSLATAAFDGVVAGAKAIPGKITELGADMLAAGKSFMGQLFDGFKAVLTSGGELANDIGSQIIAGIKSLINTEVIDRLNSSLKFTIPGGKLFPDISIDAPDIPRLASGAIVTGPTLALLGDNRSGREAIVPLERASEMGFSGGGIRTLIVQPPPGFGSDDDAYAKRLLDILRRQGANI